jgi:hypothetical protein
MVMLSSLITVGPDAVPRRDAQDDRRETVVNLSIDACAPCGDGAARGDQPQ